MSHHELLSKRKYAFDKKLKEEGIAPRDMPLTNFDFDASKFRTAYDLGARLVCMIALGQTSYDTERCPPVLEWLRREGLLQHLLDDEAKFLHGFATHEVIPYYSFSLWVQRDLAWALNDLKEVSDEFDEQVVPIVSDKVRTSLEAAGIDFEKLNKEFADPRQLSFRQSVQLMIELGTSVQGKLRQLKLRDSEEIFQQYMITRIKAMDAWKTKAIDQNKLHDILNSFILFGWMVGIDFFPPAK
jgi:hypothetical protein